MVLYGRNGVGHFGRVGSPQQGFEGPLLSLEPALSGWSRPSIASPAPLSLWSSSRAYRREFILTIYCPI